MKKLSLVIIAIIGLAFQSNAQVEITTAPVSLLFGSYALSADYYLSPDWSVGADIKSNGFSENSNGIFYGNIKHYFNPFGKAKRYYVGAFTGIYNHTEVKFFDPTPQKKISDFGGGFMGGYKLVSRKNVVLDVSAGVGRAFGNTEAAFNFMPYWKLNLGYQINTPKVKKAESDVEIF